MSQQTKKQAKQIDEYDGGNGPRPPVPGEESELWKMTSEGGAAAAAVTAATATAAAAASSSSSSGISTAATNRSPPPPPYPPSQSPLPAADSFGIRVSRWQQNFEYLLADEEGLNLLFTFVRDGGEDSKHLKQLTFYFACEGLKVINDMQKVRKVTRLISDRYLASNIIEAPPELRKTILQISRNEIEPIPHIFDELQKKVEKIIEREVYPAFLTSDCFIEFIQNREDAETGQYINETNTPPMQANSGSSNSCTGAVGGKSSSGSNTAVANSMIAGTSDGGVGTFSRINVDALSPLINPSNLQTLHEDSELKLNAESHSTKLRTDRPTPKLTKDLLLATQKGRLEVRPQGAHGYTYNVPFNSSYNPVSRQDSERQSCSSAGQTSDSEVNSKDGKPFIHRKPTAAEDYRKAHINPPSLSQKTPIRSLSQGLKDSVEPITRSKLETASCPLDYKLLFKKLECLRKEQEREPGQEHFFRNLSNRLNNEVAQPRNVQEKEHIIRNLSNRFPQVDVDAQSILDHHVSNVWSPRHTPGTTSPKNLQRPHYRPNEMSSSVPDIAMPPLRHSRSIPENASMALTTSLHQQTTRRPTHSTHHRSSQNIDSGISLYSADIPYNRVKETKPIDQFDEPMRRSSKDDSRRSRKQLPLPQQQMSSMSQPSLCHQPFNPMPVSSSHHTNSLARSHEINESLEFTFACYHFGDEKIPYRIRIPSKRLTLKQFKDLSPRKGNYRYFFQTACDDPESPIVQEEVVNDSDPVPTFEGKVIGIIRPITE